MMLTVGDDIANAQANLYVLHLDTAFADTYSAAARPSLRPSDRFESLMDDRITMTSGLEQLAGRAGGALFSVEAGTPEYVLNRVLLETGSYYVLGVEPSELDRDGKEHYIRVNTREGRDDPQPRPGHDSEEISSKSLTCSSELLQQRLDRLCRVACPAGRGFSERPRGGHIHLARRHLHVGSIGGLHAHSGQTQRRTVHEPHVPRR